MDINMAKQQVVRAGKELVESGLIARTWGNVSCRVDEKTFVVTPSGRSYETLMPEEIVSCRIEDASYEGDIKPSSERRIHALIYQTFPDINFVIHTHQPMASIISAAAINDMTSAKDPLLGDIVPIAGYGLPGTKKLRENIKKALIFSKSQAVIMAHHGALCFGKDYEETFLVAKQLEAACTEYLKNTFLKRSGQAKYSEQKYYDYFRKISGNELLTPIAPTRLYSSRRTAEGFTLQGDTETAYRFRDTMPPEAEIHRAIYQKREDINFICQDTLSSVYTISLTGKPLKPLLDDFAQIVGASAHCAKAKSPEEIVKALGNRMSVLVPACGALCCSATESDLHAVQLVVEKDAGASIGTRIIGDSKSISLFDCTLMNFVYKKSYAKKAK